jgi:hypothetical protein
MTILATIQESVAKDIFQSNCYNHRATVAPEPASQLQLTTYTHTEIKVSDSLSVKYHKTYMF